MVPSVLTRTRYWVAVEVPKENAPPTRILPSGCCTAEITCPFAAAEKV